MVSCLGSEPVRLSSWRSQYNRALRCSAAGHLLKTLSARRPQAICRHLRPSPNYQTSTSTLLVPIIVVARADKRVQRHTRLATRLEKNVWSSGPSCSRMDSRSPPPLRQSCTYRLACNQPSATAWLTTWTVSSSADLSCLWVLRVSPLSHLFKVSFTQVNSFRFRHLQLQHQLFVVCPCIVLTLYVGWSMPVGRRRAPTRRGPRCRPSCFI